MKKALLLSLPLILICLAQALAGNSPIVAGNAPAGQVPYWGSSAAGAPQIELPPPPENSGTPSHRTVLQGGDNIGDAFVIPSLPFEDNGTTSGYNDDYPDPVAERSWVPMSFTPIRRMSIKL